MNIPITEGLRDLLNRGGFPGMGELDSVDADTSEHCRLLRSNEKNLHAVIVGHIRGQHRDHTHEMASDRAWYRILTRGKRPDEIVAREQAATKAAEEAAKAQPVPVAVPVPSTPAIPVQIVLDHDYTPAINAMRDSVERFAKVAFGALVIGIVVLIAILGVLIAHR